MPIAGVLGDGKQRLEALFAGLNTAKGRPSLWSDTAAAFAVGGLASFHFPQGNEPYVVLLDGVLHNTDDLRRTLGVADAGNGAALIAAAYERWQTALFDRLAGDFACAIWHRESRQLCLARDGAAMRPLFFSVVPGGLLFASSARALRTDPAVSQDIDLDAVALRAVWAPENRPQTYFRGIQRVMPGHVLVARGGATRQQRWWRPQDVPPLRLRQAGDYAEALRATLDEAVACRLRDPDPVAMTLSSGLDSTAVAALAAPRLAAEGRRLRAFTLAPTPEPNDGMDNEAALAAVAAGAYANIDHVVLREDAPGDLIDQIEARAAYVDYPVMASVLAGSTDAMMHAIAQSGCRTVLGGGLGNFTISYDGKPQFHRLLRAGRIAGWARLSPQARRTMGWGAIANCSFGPFLSPAMVVRLRRLFGAAASRPQDWCALRPELGRTSGAFAYFEKHSAYAGEDSRMFRLNLIQRLDRGPHALYLERRFGLVCSDPTGDRRVVELCFAIPDEAFIHDGEPRSLIRRAMRGRVPDAVLDAKRRAVATIGWSRLMDRTRPRLMDEIDALERSDLAAHCLDLPRLRRLVETWPTDWSGEANRNTYANLLSRGLALGLFLRRLEGRN